MRNEKHFVGKIIKKITDKPISTGYILLWRVAPYLLRMTNATTMPNGYTINYRRFLASDIYMIAPFFMKSVNDTFNPKEGDVVVDVGANIGVFTLTGSKKAKEKGRVLAFEPDLSSVRLLQMNIQQNRCKNTHVYAFALGDAAERREFFEGIMPSASSFCPEGNRRALKTRQTKMVDVKTLDSVLEEEGIKQINWLKIDAEGFDLQILKGAQKVLKRSENVHVMVEASSNETYRLLEEYGYTVDYSRGWAHKCSA